MDSLEIEGKKYVSAKDAAREHGYTADYVGQLIRADKLLGKKVGRAWFVEVQSLASFIEAVEIGLPEMLVSHEQKPTDAVDNIALSEGNGVLPVGPSDIPKNHYKNMPVRQLNQGKHESKVEIEDVFSMRYLSDSEPVLPSIWQQQERAVSVRNTISASLSASTKTPSLPQVQVAPREVMKPISGAQGGLFKSISYAVALILLVILASANVFLIKSQHFDGTSVTASVILTRPNYFDF